MQLRGVLCAAVGMEQATRQRPAQRDRASQGLHGEAGVDPAANRVADNTPGPGVQDECNVSEAARDRDIGQVRHPHLVRAVDLEVPGDERKDRPVVIAVDGSDKATPAPRVQVVFLHQPPDLLGIDDEPAVTELGIDAAIAVGLERVGDSADLRDDRLIVGPATGLA